MTHAGKNSMFEEQAVRNRLLHCSVAARIQMLNERIQCGKLLVKGFFLIASIQDQDMTSGRCLVTLTVNV